jgi:hypothetical protein
VHARSASPATAIGLAVWLVATCAACQTGTDPQRSMPDAAATTDIAPAKNSDDARESVVVDTSTPERAMASFLGALRSRDVASLLRCFSSKRGFYLKTTGVNLSTRSRITYTELANGVAAHGDFVDLMFGDDGVDALRDYARAETHWVMQPRAKFVPEAWAAIPAATPAVSVSWSKERNRFVVDEIAFPF